MKLNNENSKAFSPMTGIDCNSLTGRLLLCYQMQMLGSRRCKNLIREWEEITVSYFKMLNGWMIGNRGGLLGTQ
jgi:hypothetical protein